MLRSIQILHGGSSAMPLAASFAALAYLIFIGSSAIQNAAGTVRINPLNSESLHQNLEKIEVQQIDLMQIKEWHLFGLAAATTGQNNAQNEIPQETEMQLKLMGIFFLPDQKKTSYAIIETADHAQKKYRPGDGVEGGITLQAIMKERVILLRNNQRESLSMKKTKLSATT